MPLLSSWMIPLRAHFRPPTTPSHMPWKNPPIFFTHPETIPAMLLHCLEIQPVMAPQFLMMMPSGVKLKKMNFTIPTAQLNRPMMSSQSPFNQFQTALKILMVQVLIVSQLAMMSAARPTTAAMIRAIGQMDRSQAAAIAMAEAVALAAMAIQLPTQAAAVVTAEATAVAAAVTVPAPNRANVPMSPNRAVPTCEMTPNQLSMTPADVTFRCAS